jgi:four helix bundle protein
MESFPKEEKYSLCDQLRRSSVSVPANIAEGMGRRSKKEQIHFLEIAFGSLMETFCHIEIAKDLGYITEEQLLQKEKQIEIISKKLSRLVSTIEESIRKNP